MSGMSSIGNFAYHWNLVASGVASVSATARTSDSSHQDLHKQDASENRIAVESATITKRTSEGMVILRYDKRARISAFGAGMNTGNRVNMTA